MDIARPTPHADVISHERRVWNASIRDVVNWIGDAGSTRPGWMPTQVQVSKDIIYLLPKVGITKRVGSLRYSELDTDKKGLYPGAQYTYTFYTKYFMPVGGGGWLQMSLKV